MSLKFGQARDSEHFPTKKGRNLNLESEVFMAPGFSRVGSIISGALGQDPGPDRFTTRRTDQSKASKDSCGLGLRDRRRRLTAIKQTVEEEVYVTSQGGRETWESVAAMEDGRVIEVGCEDEGLNGQEAKQHECELEKSSSADEANQQQMQEATEDGYSDDGTRVILNQFVEVMAAGEKERYEAGMPKELEEVYVAASKTAIEKAVRERGDEMDRMRKIELIREGVRRGYFQENNRPEDVLDDRQENRGEEKARQTENVCPDVNVTLDSERRREMWADKWNKGGDVTGQQQQEVGRQVADDEDGDGWQQGGGQQQQEDTRQAADDDETRQGGQQQQENRQEVGKGGEKQS